MRGDSLENLLVLMAGRSRYVAVKDGRWGFSQGAGYRPLAWYDTLTQALQAEAETLRQEAAAQQEKADAAMQAAANLRQDADLIKSLIADA